MEKVCRVAALVCWFLGFILLSGHPRTEAARLACLGLFLWELVPVLDQLGAHVT